MKAKPVIDALTEPLQTEVARVESELGRKPGLTVVVVGDDSASAVYVRNKTRRAEALGVQADTITLPASTTQAELLARVDTLNADTNVDGIIVQLPLPAHIDADAVINRIHDAKDVDGFTLQTTGRLWTLPKGSSDQVGPCTPLGIMQLLDYYDIPLAGQNVVIVGRSNIVGKPLAAMMLNRSATVTIAHSRTQNLPALLRTADVIVAATGRINLITADCVRPGATVIDVGMNRVVDDAGKAHFVGDVDFDAVAPIAGAITPVPGGVGPMTVNTLMKQTIARAVAAVKG